jgi:hypothetical protein
MKLHESEFGVKQMCQVLGVNRSGYYAWRSRPDSRRAQANQRLLVQIREEYQLSRKTYGSPRIHATLRRKGVRCSRKRVARLMRLDKIAARRARRHIPRTSQKDPNAIPAPNLLNQDFSSPAPDRKWVSDTPALACGASVTYIEPPKAGCIWLRFWTCFRGGWWVGPWTSIWKPPWRSRLGTWRSRNAVLRLTCCIIRTRAANTPVQSICRAWRLITAKSV